MLLNIELANSPDWWEAILLGIVQGITEFLPVSSSGHLEIAKHLTGTLYQGEESLFLTVILHFATALSTLIVFRKDIAQIFRDLISKDNEAREFVLKIILSMIPAALVGIFLEEQIDQLFADQLLLVAVALVVTGLLLFFADRSLRNNRSVGRIDACLIGIAQAVAILPGISRSGATIASAILLKIDRSKATRFSFLMVVPLIFAKMGKDLLEVKTYQQIDLFSTSLAFVAALLAGIIACNWMIALVKNSKLSYFAGYCLFAAIFAALLHFNVL